MIQPSGNPQSEIHRLLKIGQQEVLPQPQTAEVVSPSQPEQIIVRDPAVDSQTRSRKTSVMEIVKKSYKKISSAKYGGLLVYPAIFAVSFMFFYVGLNLPSFISQVSAQLNNKSQNEQMLKDRLPAYNAWIQGYYFSVGKKELLSATADIDNDGLSNMDEFIIRTNPTIADSDSDGSADGIEVINQTNPWGSGRMTKQQLKLIADLDSIMINNRISFNAASVSSNEEEQKYNFDTSKPGRLSIPKLGLQVPLVFSKTVDEFDADLTRGVVHYPGTALPGEKGTVYVSGHSSDYLWKKHPYKQVFAKINLLEPGDDIFIDVYGIDGEVYNFRYKVFEEKVYAPDDQTQFIDNSRFKLNLSTCWPIGTQKDRYVVSALLDGV